MFTARALPRMAVGVLLATSVATAMAQDGAKTLSARFREVAKAAIPATVSIRAEAPPRIVPPGVFMQGVPMGPALIESSGVVIDAEAGWVLATGHGLTDTGAVRVVLSDGEVRTPSEIRIDPASDLALLKVEPAGLSALPWREGPPPEIGDWVVAVGGPRGFAGSVSAGIVGGLGRSLSAFGPADLIQTDASILPGSSGGPLVDLEGRLVGITVAMRSESGMAEGIGFAIPAARAARVAADLAQSGRVRRAYLGVTLSNPAPIRLDDPGTTAIDGVLVSGVTEPGPAAEAGIRPGDRIVKVGDRAVASQSALLGAIEFVEPGEPLPITIRRGDSEEVVEVVPTERPGTLPAGGGVLIPMAP